MANIPSLFQLFPGLQSHRAPGDEPPPAMPGDPAIASRLGGWPRLPSSGAPVGLPGVPVNWPRPPTTPGDPGYWTAPIPSWPNSIPDTARYALPTWAQALLELPLAHFNEEAAATPAPGAARLTHINFTLDASGSMLAHKAAVIEGFNTQVAKVKEGAAGVGEVQFTAVRFNEHVTVDAERSTLEQLRALSAESYQPGGGTALFDAVGEAIGALLRCPRAHAPETAFLVTVFTDGEELSSRRFSASALRGLIERLTATGRWTFALMGPTGSVQSLGAALAVPPSNVGRYEPLVAGQTEGALMQVTGATTSYLSARAAGARSMSGLFSGG